MSFSNSTWKCQRISGYPAAVRHFSKTKKPRTVRWGEDERPLYNVASHHYRLVRGPLDASGDAEYYDAVLYSMPMLRMFKPKEDGTVVRWVANHHSQTSRGFLYNVCGIDSGGQRLLCNDSQERRLPLSSYTSQEYVAPNGVTVPACWSAVLVERNGALVLEESAHRLVYTRVASDEDKKERKEFRKKIAQYLDILTARRSTYKEEVLVSYDQGEYGGFRQNTSRSFTPLATVGRTSFNEINEAAFAYADKVAKNVYANMLARVYVTEVAAKNPKLLSEIARLEAGKYSWAVRHAKVRASDLPLSVDAAAFRKTVSATLLRNLSLDSPSGRKYLDMFPTQLPKKYWG
ncbi:MAG: hypothetical protein ACO3SE_07915 [Sedimenticolaceae bacterium]